MSRSTFTLFVGVFNVALYMLMTLYTVMFTFFFDVVAEVVTESENITEEAKSAVEEVSDIVHVMSYISLGFYVIMFLASMSMVYGVKKERHSYLAPWVYMTVFGIIYECCDIFIEMDKTVSEHTTFASILTVVLAAAFWYPVYKHYQCLKHPKTVAATQKPCHCTAPCYVTNAEYSHVNAKFVPTSMAVC